MIEHEVMVSAIDPQKQTLSVRLTAQSACAGCAAKASCAAHGSELKEWIVVCDHLSDFKVGQNALLIISEKKGFKAVFWAYVAPLICMIALLFGVSIFTKNELLIGLAVLLGLALYFIGLSCMKKRLHQSLSYTIKPLSQNEA